MKESLAAANLKRAVNSYNSSENTSPCHKRSKLVGHRPEQKSYNKTEDHLASLRNPSIAHSHLDASPSVCVI